MVPDELLFRSKTFQKTNPCKHHERSQEEGMAPYVECQPGIAARARAGMSWSQKVTKQCLTSFNLLLTRKRILNRLGAVAQFHLSSSPLAEGGSCSRGPEPKHSCPCAFHVLFNSSATSSVHLNVLVERWRDTGPSCRFNYTEHCELSRSASGVLIMKAGCWPQKKSITLVSQDYWCFLWLHLCTPTMSPFTETATGGHLSP